MELNGKQKMQSLKYIKNYYRRDSMVLLSSFGILQQISKFLRGSKQKSK